MIVADTSGLLALFNRREPTHAAVKGVVDAEPEPLLISPYVVAELDYLVATRLGVDADLEVLAEVDGGRTTLLVERFRGRRRVDRQQGSQSVASA
ncbi:hypothetical protein BH20ACT23_BH20ACT23_30160 [soil metagenome]